MQAGEAREWFHDVSPGEENLPFLWQPVDQLHAKLGLTALCPLYCPVLLSLLLCWIKQLCGCRVSVLI